MSPPARRRALTPEFKELAVKRRPPTGCWTKPLRGGNPGAVVVLKSRCYLAVSESNDVTGSPLQPAVNKEPGLLLTTTLLFTFAE